MKLSYRDIPVSGILLAIAGLSIGWVVVKAIVGPDKTADARRHYNAAIIAIGRNDLATADDELHAALAITPADALFLYKLALTQSKAGHPVAAMKSLAKARALGLPPDQRDNADELLGTLTYKLKTYSQRLLLSPREDGTTSIASPLTGLCVAVPSSSEAPGVALIQAPCTGKPNQQLLIDWVGDEKWRIIATHSHLCFDVPNSSLKSGVRLIQYSCTGQPNQYFQVQALDNKTSRIIAEHSHLCLDLGEQGVVIQRDCLDPVPDTL